MCASTLQDLRGVAETLLIPLYVRALETQRPDALLNDEKAVQLVARWDAEFERIRQIKMDSNDRVALVLRNREFDRSTRDFLERHPESVVVHIGCGLDSRFDRVDNGQVEWYDLDLPEVIALRRELIGDQGPRYHLLSSSAFDRRWLDAVRIHGPRPFLFLAEGVFMYFEEAKIRSLVLTLRRYFGGAELIFDAFSPFLVWMNNLRFMVSRSRLSSRYRWGLKHGKNLEAWNSGISLIGTWYPFDNPEPRLAQIQWIRHISFLAKVMGVFHYRLGQTAT